MGQAADRLWSLTRHNGGVRASDLLRALADPVLLSDSNPRTPILVRDSIRTLELQWGESVFRTRLGHLCDPAPVLDFARKAGDDYGFPSLERRTMDTTERDDILAVFREIGARLHQPVEIVVGGSTALILEALIIHQTEDINVVNEVPEVIRTDYALLNALGERFSLQLTHFQSHYLPDGWRGRTKSLGQFGQLSVRIVDALDVLVGKLFSRRNKDYVHVAEAWKQIDRDAFRDRLMTATASLRADEGSRSAGKHNWYVLTGEDELPMLPRG